MRFFFHLLWSAVGKYAQRLWVNRYQKHEMHFPLSYSYMYKRERERVTIRSEHSRPALKRRPVILPTLCYYSLTFIYKYKYKYILKGIRPDSNT